MGERVRAAVESAYIDTQAGPLQATVSLGVASLGHTTMALEFLLAVADRALYEAKGAGRNCVRIGHIDNASAVRSAKTVKRRQTYSLVTARRQNNRPE